MSRTAAILILILFSASMAQAKNRPDLAPAIGSRGLLDCSQAAVITCGEAVTGSNVGMPSNVESYSCSGWQESFGETVYELVLTGPAHSVVLATLADMSCDLDIFLLGSCNEGDCLAHGDEAAYAPDLPPGVYYIVVDGYGGECSFTLRVECIPLSRPCCPLASYGYDFDFGSSDHGFWTLDCGGEPTWSWGPNEWTGTPGCDGEAITNLLCTSPNGDYPDNAGQAAVIGPVAVTEQTSCLELCHAYHIEEDYDGGVVKVSYDQGGSWETVAPSRAYDHPTDEDTTCIPLEYAFADEFQSAWLRDCFDLSSYEGLEIWIGFFFGSDDIFSYPGWFIQRVRLGRSETGVAPSSWGGIKAIYR